MNSFLQLLLETLQRVAITLQHNWPYLVLSILIAVLLKLFVDANRVAGWLNRHRGAGVVGATAAAVATPLCSCGTTAVILGMMASTLPWAPVVAFMVASPLTSPQELVYSAGLFGWPFAWAFFLSSILLGLTGGLVAGALESRGWLAGQARFANVTRAAQSPALASAAADESLSRESTPARCGCANAAVATSTAVEPLAFGLAEPALAGACCGGGSATLTADACDEDPAECACRDSAGQSDAVDTQPDIPRATWKRFFGELGSTGQRLLAMFLGFAFIGYLLNGLIPATWVSTLFGSGKLHSVPFAATLGLPLYLNSEASLPLVRAMLDNGMSQGAALAFLITGAGTSIGAIAGALTIARWRVVSLVVATLWVGAIVFGYGYDALLAAGLI